MHAVVPTSCKESGQRLVHLAHCTGGGTLLEDRTTCKNINEAVWRHVDLQRSNKSENRGRLANKRVCAARMNPWCERDAMQEHNALAAAPASTRRRNGTDTSIYDKISTYAFVSTIRSSTVVTYLQYKTLTTTFCTSKLFRSGQRSIKVIIVFKSICTVTIIQLQ